MKSLLGFHAGISAASHATLEKEQLILCMRIVIVENITSLHDYHEELVF